MADRPGQSEIKKIFLKISKQHAVITILVKGKDIRVSIFFFCVLTYFYNQSLQLQKNCILYTCIVQWTPPILKSVNNYVHKHTQIFPPPLLTAMTTYCIGIYRDFSSLVQALVYTYLKTFNLIKVIKVRIADNY